MGAGPPLVWVANWLTHLNLDLKSPLLSHWFQALSQGHTLIRYDARGNGLSDRVVDDLSVDTWTWDLEAVVDDLGLERFPLLGFCQGGATAMTYTNRHPERVNRLILYDSYAQGAFTDGMPASMKREAEALAEMIEVGWGQEATAFREVFANLLVPGASKQQQRWLAEKQRQTVSPKTAARLWRAFHNIDVRKTAMQVSVPTLIFHVQGDNMVPFEEGRRLAALISEARFVPLEGRNHILLEEDPGWQPFLAELRDFLGTEIPGYDPIIVKKAIADLTPREREVLHLMGQGLSNSEIAERLVIAPKTARNYTSRIYTKLQLDNRAQAILIAQQVDLDHSSR
jgi:pimeloyl-ACP methyl ester carboxylesterase/DNA-binding CsgD family transcriptional regulator